MKTMTVRLDEDVLTLIEAIAAAQGARPSDVLRAAVANYLVGQAEANPDIARMRGEIVARRRTENDNQMIDTFGGSADQIVDQ